MSIISRIGIPEDLERRLRTARYGDLRPLAEEIGVPALALSVMRKRLGLSFPPEERRDFAKRKRGRPPGSCPTKYRKTPAKVVGVRAQVRDGSLMPTEAERARLQAFCDQCAPGGRRAECELVAKNREAGSDRRAEALRALWEDFRCRLPLVEAELHVLVGPAELPRGEILPVR